MTMTRRDFVRTGAAAGAGLLGGQTLWATEPHRADLVLRGALVFDGSGTPPIEVDVALAGDRIAGMGPRLRASGARKVELRGLALAPGFVDIHSHADLPLLVEPRAESRIRQGVTTEVVGQDGSSIGPWTWEQAARFDEAHHARYGVALGFRDLAGFFGALEQRGSAVNVASMVGQGTIRGFVVGEGDRPAIAAEIERMREQVRAALAAGACGVSSGLEYTPGAFATSAEIAAVVEPLRETGLPYSTHMRNEDDRLLAAIEEAVDTGRMSGAAVQISHLKCQGERNWWKVEPALETIAAARTGGMDVMFDVYPYIAFSTGLANLFPIRSRDGGDEAFIARLRDPALRPELEAAVRAKIDQLGSWDSVQVTSTHSDELAWARGRRLGQLATERGDDPYELLVRLIVEDRNRAGMVAFGMSEGNVARKLAHPLSLVCSDGGAFAPYGPLSEGSPHPRAYGAFPRVLGHFCRELGTLPLETAIHKMTLLPATRLRLGGRGRIAPGAFADLVAFDPDRVADRATFSDPHRYPDGIPHVWVNGRPVIQGGEQTGELPGRPLRPAAG
jgi:N-acyl-D-amino-acid deacylase